MSSFTLRRKAKHTAAAVRAAASAAEIAEPQDLYAAQDEPAAAAGAPADYSLDYDATGWDEGESHDATSPGFLPPGDDTMVFRVPGTGGASGFAIPAATLRTDPEDAEAPEAPLPLRSPGAVIPAALVPVLRTGAASPAMLRKVADGLRALPGDPGTARLRAAMAQPGPAAWLRAIMPGRRSPWDALPGRPSFAGIIRDPDGLPYAGLYLGEPDDDGRMVIDVRDERWLHDLIGAAYEALDAMEEAGGAPGGRLQHGPVASGTPA